MTPPTPPLTPTPTPSRSHSPTDHESTKSSVGHGAPDHTGNPRIGVIVIGRNEGARLIACIKSVTRPDTRVVYVDSQSSDDSVANARAAGAVAIELKEGKLTAARGRQTGLDWFKEHHPDLEWIQFVDGDCIVDTQWFEHAETCLQSDAKIAGVSGRRFEEDLAGSIYHRMTDIEWNTPAGPVDYFGGDSFVRASAIRSVGGWSVDLIAGEEPELCFRLGQAGWKMHRLDVTMAGHDIQIYSFGAFARRYLRSGHAYAEVGWRHRHGHGKKWWKRARGMFLQGIVLPLMIVAALVSSAWLGAWGLVIAGILMLPFLWWGGRTYQWCRGRNVDRGLAMAYALCTVASKPYGGRGVLRFFWGQLSGSRSNIIEYQASNATSSAAQAQTHASSRQQA